MRLWIAVICYNYSKAQKEATTTLLQQTVYEILEMKIFKCILTPCSVISWIDAHFTLKLPLTMHSVKILIHKASCHSKDTAPPHTQLWLRHVSPHRPQMFPLQRLKAPGVMASTLWMGSKQLPFFISTCKTLMLSIAPGGGWLLKRYTAICIRNRPTDNQL